MLGADLLGGLAFAARPQRLEAAQCRRVELTGDDDVDGRARRQLDRQRAGGGGDPAAEHRAQCQLGGGLDDGAGGQEDEPTVAAGRDVRRGGAADLERRPQHRVVGGVVVAVGREDRTGRAAAGVDDDDVETAERGDGIGDDSRSGAAVR